MKNLVVRIFSIAIIALMPNMVAAQVGTGFKQSFDFGWRFHLGDVADAQDPQLDVSAWRLLDIPHDFSIEQPFDSINSSKGGGGYAYGGIGWYRKDFVLPESHERQKVTIHFEGVYRNSEVWINGHYLGFWPNGYTPFCYDLSPFLNPAGQKNVLAVKVNTTEQPNSRWYSGAGIYRHVWLHISGKTHFKQWGVFATTKNASDNNALIELSAHLINENDEVQACEFFASIVSADGNVVATTDSSITVNPREPLNLVQNIVVESPHLWSVEQPYLYTLNVSLFSNGKKLDTYSTKIGIRTFEFDANKGFLLNGKHVKLKGANLHHDGGPLGAACLDQTFYRQLLLLKEIGANGIRTSHNPPAPGLLKAADSLGLVVVNEVFDEWIKEKTKAGYAPYFSEYYKKDIQNWVESSRNHPSVIAWSIGNELPEQKDIENGPEVAQMIIDEVRKHDLSRPVTIGASKIHEMNESGMSDMLDIVGYNYFESLYETQHQQYPSRVIYASESSIYPYHPGDCDPMHTYDQWLVGQKEDFVAGEFVWTGFDYLGEAGIGDVGTECDFAEHWPNPEWPGFGATCGLFDICGFQKPAAWFRKALWTDEPMVYIAVETHTQAKQVDKASFWSWAKVEHHWNHHTVGDSVTVHVYTNVSDVELKMNGRSLGKKQWDLNSEAFLVWEVPFEKGRIEAVGYLPDGQLVTNSVQTAGEPVKIQLISEKDELVANSQDLCYVRAILLDKDGIQVPFAQDEISFEVTGAGKLTACGSGNLKSYVPYKGSKTKAFRGACLAIIQSEKETGPVVVSASAKGIKSSQIAINVK